ncbi:MAG: DUF2399 domain-containing protein [Anaerolineales bacterium]|nr:DUF2399 domain-containing protein [Anaerolineales bacterium]
MNEYDYIVQHGELEFWPDELWQILQTLVRQTHQVNRARQPQIRITKKNCPKYTSPSNDRAEFHQALQLLEQVGVIQIDWLPNASQFVEKIRLINEGQEILNELINTYFPFIPKEERKTLSAQDWDKLIQTVNKYGTLGLRTASHITFGNSHRLDNIRLPNDLGIWEYQDVTVEGANIIRAAGRMSLVTPYGAFNDRWDISGHPGHYLWPWDIQNLTVQAIGQCLILIENPYPMWELMARWKNQDITLVCLHGFATISRSSILATFLDHIYQAFPNLETWIWCDLDPNGLIIANYAYDLVNQLGGRPKFWLMDEAVLEQLEEIILADTKLQILEEEKKDYQILRDFHFNSSLQPLANALLNRRQKGEQEGLVVTL